MANINVVKKWTQAESRWVQKNSQSWVEGYKQLYGCVPVNLHWYGYVAGCQGEIGWVRHPTDSSTEVLIRIRSAQRGHATEEIREYRSKVGSASTEG